MTYRTPRSACMLIGIAFIPLLAGCAVTYRAGRVPDTLPWPPEQAGTRKSATVQADRAEIIPSFVALLDDSRLFIEVLDDRSSKPTDLYITVDLTFKFCQPWYYIMLSVLGGLIIPAPRGYWYVSAELIIEDSARNRLGLVTKSEKETILESFLYLPFPPFVHRRELADLYGDVIRAAITEAHVKGLF